MIQLSIDTDLIDCAQTNLHDQKHLAVKTVLVPTCKETVGTIRWTLHNAHCAFCALTQNTQPQSTKAVFQNANHGTWTCRRLTWGIAAQADVLPACETCCCSGNTPTSAWWLSLSAHHAGGTLVSYALWCSCRCCIERLSRLTCSHTAVLPAMSVLLSLL